MTSKVSAISRFRHLLPNLILTVPLLILVVLLAIELGINGYLIAFSVTVYGLVAALVLFQISSAHQQQLNILSDLLDALIQGDYTFRGRDLYTRHFQSLLERVNQLALTLHRQTVTLRENQLLIQQVIDHMDAAVLALDSQGKVIFSNRAALSLFAMEKGLPQALLAQLSQTDNGQSIQLLAQWCTDLHPGGEFLLGRERFITQGETNQLLVLSEVGQLLHHNESAAWQRLVRVISHEINNSMAPVNTISRTMLRQSQKLQLPESFVQGLNVIQDRCEHMIGFIASYSKITQLPAPDKKPTDLQTLLNSCCGLFDHRTIDVIGETDISIFCDSGQMKQVLINLLKNADQAMPDGDQSIVVEVKTSSKQLTLTITDSGCGITNPDNLFVPFYTTKQDGSGIGLMLSQQIVNNHYGKLALNNRPDGQGAVATLVLPI